MKTFCISALKGGVGKTITAMSLSYVAAMEFDKKVLLIDMDSQSTASIDLGITPNNYDKRTPFENLPELLKKVEDEDMNYEEDFLEDYEDYDREEVEGIHTIFEAMMINGKDVLSKELVDRCIHTPVFSITQTKKNEKGEYVKDEQGRVIREKVSYKFGFDVIPSCEALCDIQLIWPNPAVTNADGEVVKNRACDDRGRQLSTLVDFIERNYDYDYCIIDCPPALDLLTANSWYASKSGGIVIAVSQDRQSLFSLMRMKNQIKVVKDACRGHIGIDGIVQTIYNDKRIVDKYISKTAGKDTRLHVFKTRISETADAKKALLSGLILPQVNDKNYNETVKLFKEIEGRIAYLTEREESK